MYLYKNGKLYLDRLEALKALDAYKAEEPVQMLYLSALKDPMNTLRIEAIAKIKDFSAAQKSTALPILKEMAVSDKESNVRARAVRALHEVYPTENIDNILVQASNDSSYAVNAAVLKIYSKTDSAKALALCIREEKTMNSSMTTAIAEFYASKGTEAANQFFVHFLEHTSGFGPLFIVQYYKTYLLRQSDEIKTQGTELMYHLASNATISFVKNSFKLSIKEVANKMTDEGLKAEALKKVELLEGKSAN